MSWQPLLEASWVIQVHTFSCLAALVLGLVQIFGPKGTLPHKFLGSVWVSLMLVICISSIFIRPSIDGYDLPFLQWFSWIHLFTVNTLFWIGFGLYYLHKGGPKLKRHGISFIMIFIGGLIIAGGFALMPGRIMHEVVFGVG